MTAQATWAPWLDGPRFDYGTRTLPELVLANAARTPNAAAVRQWAEQLTYGELMAAATELARILRGHGVRPETVVGLCLRRRPSMVVGVLGTLLSGGAYLPMDPDGPATRRDQLAADAAVDVIVVDAQTAALLDGAPQRLVRVPDPGGHAGRQLVPDAGMENPAYVLYTSGSTGRPKGVVITHRSLVAHVLAFADITGAGQDTRAFGFTSLGFDVSVHDLLLPLAVGGSVALIGEDDRTDPQRLQRFAAEHAVNWGFVPPALLPLLDPAGLPRWRTVYTGAEAPGPEQVARWTAGGRRFVHAYGPTEATVCVTWFEARGHWDRPLPIGRPQPNHRLLVVDERLRPLGPGEPGELLIGGVGLARGYLGDAALTAQRFVPDPCWPDDGGADGSDQGGRRLYRTGDRVVRLDDGNLLFLGRADRQVKIRGQRVELGEPETVLRGHPRVLHAVVDTAAGELVAYCTVLDPPGRDAPGEDELRAYCRRRLPAAMVPSRILRLPTLPMTPSGKVDLAALRTLLDQTTAAALADGTVDGARPVGELQTHLAELWARALGRDDAGRVRLSDDFFAAGGHSVAVMRLVAAIRARLRREVSAEDVFAARTLAGLVSRVAAAPAAGAALRTGNPPALSPSQRRLWFLDKLAPGSAAYNISFAERLTGELDVAALRAALTAVATRHDVLRWRITDTAGVPRAVCDPPAQVPLPVVELPEPAGPAGAAALADRLAADAGTAFDLATGPVWRAVLYRLGPREHVLSLTLHHAVCDGWSQAVLYRDLAAAYAGRELPPPPAGYADYAVWRAAADERHGADDLAWWTGHLAGAPTVLRLPADRPRPAVQSYAGAFASTVLPAPVDAAIRGLAATLGATPSAVLLAGLGELLRRLTGGDDHVIGAVVADRRLAEVDELVGFFVDVLPVRLRAAGGRSFADAVRAGLTELLDVTAHSTAPLDRIVGALGVRRDPSRSPLVQVLFNVFNFAEPSLRLPGLAAETVRVPMPGSPFDLTVYLVERAGAFALDVVYNPDLFDAARIEAFLADYVAVLAALTAAPHEPVAAVPVPVTSPPGTTDRTRAPGAAVHSAAVHSAAATAPGPAPGQTQGPAHGPALPETATERLVARVWCEVLGRPAVRATDNFFDIGGGSLAMMAVHARLTDLLGRRLPVVELFQWPTVRALAGHLDGSVTGDGPLARAAQRAAARRDAAQRNRPQRTQAQPTQAQPTQAQRTQAQRDRARTTRTTE